MSATGERVVRHPRTLRAEAQYTLDERLAASKGLSSSERAVATFVSRNRERVPFMSATDIAAAAGVGTATVVRAAKRLGYRGLVELKAELQADLQARASIPESLGAISEEASSPDRLLDEMVVQQAEALRQTFERLDRVAFEQAVDLLAGADRIAILVGGIFGGVTQYLGRRLRLGGRRVLLLDTPDVSESIVELGAGDVVVAFAFEGMNDRLSLTLDVAERSAVPVVLITDTLALALRDRCAVGLSVRHRDVLELPAAVGVAAVVDALLAALSGRDPSIRA